MDRVANFQTNELHLVLLSGISRQLYDVNMHAYVKEIPVVSERSLGMDWLRNRSMCRPTSFSTPRCTIILKFYWNTSMPNFPINNPNAKNTCKTTPLIRAVLSGICLLRIYRQIDRRCMQRQSISVFSVCFRTFKCSKTAGPHLGWENTIILGLASWSLLTTVVSLEKTPKGKQWPEGRKKKSRNIAKVKTSVCYRRHGFASYCLSATEATFGTFGLDFGDTNKQNRYFKYLKYSTGCLSTIILLPLPILARLNITGADILVVETFLFFSVHFLYMYVSTFWCHKFKF